jgi:hypothetical protein
MFNHFLTGQKGALPVSAGLGKGEFGDKLPNNVPWVEIIWDILIFTAVRWGKWPHRGTLGRFAFTLPGEPGDKLMLRLIFAALAVVFVLCAPAGAAGKFSAMDDFMVGLGTAADAKLKEAQAADSTAALGTIERGLRDSIELAEWAQQKAYPTMLAQPSLQAAVAANRLHEVLAEVVKRRAEVRARLKL